MMDQRRMEDQFKLNKHPKGHFLSPKDPHVNCIFHLCIWNIFFKITIHIYIISYYNMHPILHIYYPHPLDTWCRISHHSPVGLRLAKHLQESTQAKWWGSRRRACPGPKFRIHGTNSRYIYLHANHKNSTKCRWMYQSHGFYGIDEMIKTGWFFVSMMNLSSNQKPMAWTLQIVRVVGPSWCGIVEFPQFCHWCWDDSGKVSGKGRESWYYLCRGAMKA